MGFEIFTRKMTRTTDPMVTMMSTGRISLNKTASARLHDKAIDRVVLMWDKDTRRVGIKPFTKRDSRTYKISYSGKGNSAALSTVTFFHFIDYKTDKTRSYPVNWSDDEGMYIFTIPPEHLAVRRTDQRSVAQTHTPTAKIPPKERPAAAAVTQ
jgi:hypothetical protein